MEKRSFWFDMFLMTSLVLSVFGVGLGALEIVVLKALDRPTRCAYESLWDYNPGRVLVCLVAKPFK